MKVLYICFTDFKPTQVGASVRPQKMYKAFVDEGHEVKLLCGRQGNIRSENKRLRLQAVREISRWLDTDRPDICYIESPVYPILWAADRALLRKIHRLGIPMGYFFRDFYWKFPEYYPRRTDPVGALKEKTLDILQHMTNELLNCVDIVYFPSIAASRYFNYKDMRALPPAGESGNVCTVGEPNTSIYVGGLPGDYGGEELLRAFALLNSGAERYPLLLVCREREWAAIPDELKTGDWLEVHHTSGDGLKPLYARASLAVMPVQRNAYTDISVNIKFFEYMSYGLPVASTDVTAIAELVKGNAVGSVSGDTPGEIAENIRAMFADAAAMERWRRNAEEMYRSRNLWVHRVRQVVSELGAIGEGR